MRILVGWDDAEEADLIALYLNIEDDDVVDVVTDKESLLQQAARGSHWDVLLITTRMPDMDGANEVFQQLLKLQPGVPIVGACFQEDVFRIARFMTAGMRGYALRDAGGDFIFLLRSTLEGAVEAVAAEREQRVSVRLREEMESVRKLQESIIPKDLSCPEGYRICARYETSQIRVMGGQPVSLAGGDYYDAFSLDDNSVVLLVGDASGHGMKAAMSIMTMHTLVRMIQRDQYRDTAAFVKQVNNHLCKQSVINDEGGFITLLYGVLQADRGEFRWSSAGHQVPLLQDLAGESIEEVGSHDVGGLPLGIYPDLSYEAFNLPLPRRSRLLLYTDGLVEAFPDEAGEHAEFGLEGVIEALHRSRTMPLEQALQSLFDASNAFTKGAGRHDDTSVVMVERY